ncbi:hypothetical protein FACS189449_09100 [Alphaproteobacteria bacterium]|nr:hypothetical protein FACS189449_09100 [Alphaproteobacteria bacterium]
MKKVLYTTIVTAVFNLSAANSSINIPYIKLSGEETTTATMRTAVVPAIEVSPEEAYNEFLAYSNLLAKYSDTKRTVEKAKKTSKICWQKPMNGWR